MCTVIVSSKKKNKYIYNKYKSQCKDCGGSGICEHSRIRWLCKDCGGSGICEHSRQRSQCKDCGGSSNVSIVDRELSAKTVEVVVYVSMAE